MSNDPAVADDLREVSLSVAGVASIDDYHRLVYDVVAGPDGDGRRDWIFGLPVSGRPIVTIRGRSLPQELEATARAVEFPTVSERRRFVLRANPTRRRQGLQDPNWKGRRQLRGRDDVADWIVAQGRSHGFEVVRRSLETDFRTTEFHRNGRRIDVSDVIFSGVLEVTDPPALAGALERGIGRMKGFGYGLLRLLAEPTSTRLQAQPE